eukprot:2989294-Rhodomonas_salina.1
MAVGSNLPSFLKFFDLCKYAKHPKGIALLLSGFSPWKALKHVVELPFDVGNVLLSISVAYITACGQWRLFTPDYCNIVVEPLQVRLGD